jgi:hypothetical protein
MAGPRHRRYRELQLTETTLSKQPSRLRARWWWRGVLELRGLQTVSSLPSLSILSRDALGMGSEGVGREGAYSRSPRLSHRVRAMHRCYFFFPSSRKYLLSSSVLEDQRGKGFELELLLFVVVNRGRKLC